jgi:hypothetical protein
LLVVETSKGEAVETPGFTLLDTRDYGETSVIFLCLKEL